MSVISSGPVALLLTGMLSHIHQDHTGELHDFLDRNSDVTVYFPQTFPAAFRGVRTVAPSHCTGDRAIRIFRKEWGEDFVEGGPGAVIEVPG